MSLTYEQAQQVYRMNKDNETTLRSFERMHDTKVVKIRIVTAMGGSIVQPLYKFEGSDVWYGINHIASRVEEEILAN
ncbi:MAG: hypothetical protein QF486_00330 [Candidatus Woesearchaeota archaeon]|nr:hypothetical protein [Candidatus Woesearchaeota archaeon]MDP7181330.1 hypothetical protein [Candidatus Woesearchaeota archaeon]MDP7198051.1 hypothetical protein [Candidatus Woesearchaeota archaeon]MDP7466885.1 hypothetical protein [Candidatus Woesearchaeota archaeon]MDP7647321.1 hypothetical protein [Candidatus Woesearchaeota archaeon]